LKRIGLALLLLSAGTDAPRAALRETPMFEEQVASERLPKVEERIPRDVKVAVLPMVGSPGGELRMLMAGPKDTRMMVVYGYARLVGYTPALNIEPDILK
jgi:peptide/nickel transport system substrate-binding protein